MVGSEWWGYKVRADVAAEYISGSGIEIGAGANPQLLPPGASCLYFDKSNAAHLSEQFGADIRYPVHHISEIRARFPDGADFLIAHNVLEHIHGEIAALIEWHSYVRDGGVIVLSVPLRDHTNGDSRRLSTPISHLIEDYVLKRGPASYEAREHSYSFCLGWDADEVARAWHYLDRKEFVNYVLDQAHFADADLHWHALNRPEWDFVIAAAAHFGERGVELLRCAGPTTPDISTQGEVIYIYRLGPAGRIKGFGDPVSHLEIMKDRYLRALEILRIPTTPVTAPSI